MVLSLPEELDAPSDEELYGPTTITMGFVANDESDDEFNTAEDENYYTIVYTLKSDTQVVWYNEGCGERDFEESVAMTGIQRMIYNFVNKWLASPIGLKC
jgi:hypothetical protein